jgi:NitT/TauT family transport system ATP-binding protein
LDASKVPLYLITHDLREAVFLSDTVYVMGPRPSSIVYKVKVNLPRPTTIDMMISDEFNHIVAELRRHIHRN